jgi:hypothetical protein
LRRSGEGVKGRCLPWSKEEEGAYIFWMKQVPVVGDSFYKAIFNFIIVDNEVSHSVEITSWIRYLSFFTV